MICTSSTRPTDQSHGFPRSDGKTTVVRSGGVGADNVQGDARSMFFSDSQLKRYGH